MQDICDLLEYIGLCEDDLEVVYNKMYFWSFVISLAEQFKERGSLSPKQKDSLVALVLKHTGAVCDTSVITHGTQYERKGEGNKSTGKRVDHDFGQLHDIQLFDLPYDSGSTQTADFYPYNSHTTVINIKGKLYRIPLPSKWPKFKATTSITFEYKRTACKGYMKEVSPEGP